MLAALLNIYISNKTGKLPALKAVVSDKTTSNKSLTSSSPTQQHHSARTTKAVKVSTQKAGNLVITECITKTS